MSVLTRLVPHIELSDAAFRARHRVLRLILWLHLPLVAVVSLVTGEGTGDARHRSCGPSSGPPRCAPRWPTSRRRRAAARSPSRSACCWPRDALVHGGGGLTDLHFHFFVVLALIGLYQDWVHVRAWPWCWSPSTTSASARSPRRPVFSDSGAQATRCCGRCCTPSSSWPCAPPRWRTGTSGRPPSSETERELAPRRRRMSAQAQREAAAEVERREQAARDEAAAQVLRSEDLAGRLETLLGAGERHRRPAADRRRRGHGWLRDGAAARSAAPSATPATQVGAALAEVDRGSGDDRRAARVGGRHRLDRRADPGGRRPDQPAGAQRHHRGGPRRRGRQGLRGRGRRGQGAGRADGDGDRPHRGHGGRGDQRGRRGRRGGVGRGRAAGRRRRHPARRSPG